MNPLANAFVAILLPLFLVEANVKIENATSGSGSSPWLRNVLRPRPRPAGCMYRPWICSKRQHPPTARMRCCRNHCVDVASDNTHCGLCAIRCPFTWQCCKGFCTNTNLSPFNCGSCGNRCRWGVPCLYGICGYAEPRLPHPPPHTRPPTTPQPPCPMRPPLPPPPRPPEICPPHPRPPPLPQPPCPPCPRQPPFPQPPMRLGICPPSSTQPPEGDQPPSKSKVLV